MILKANHPIKLQRKLITIANIKAQLPCSFERLLQVFIEPLGPLTDSKRQRLEDRLNQLFTKCVLKK